MKFKSLFVLLILCFNILLVYPESHYIELDSTYCKGQVELYFPPVFDLYEPYQDTILFSNNLKLIGIKDIFELPWMLIGDRVFFIPNDFKRWGNKHVLNPDTLTFNIPDNHVDPNNFYRNNDIYWESAIVFPDSLIPLEKLNSVINNDSIEAKAIFTSCSYYDERFAIWSAERLLLEEGEPQIFYLESTEGRKIKFLINVKAPWNFDSIIVSWAADSLGNGLFDDPVRINNHKKDNNRFSLKISQNKNKAFIQFNTPLSTKIKIDIYTTDGKFISNLIDEYRLSGKYSFALNSKIYKAGIYFIRLSTRHFMASKSFVFVK